jgi:TrmH family RNA methyltransferase
MGTLFRMKIDCVKEICADISALCAQGRRVFAAMLNAEAKRLGEFEIRRGDCVVIGNEGHGISEDTVSVCTDSVYIPMSENVESLNAATAATVLVWEFFGSGRCTKEEL